MANLRPCKHAAERQEQRSEEEDQQSGVKHRLAAEREVGAAERRQALLSLSPRHHHRLLTFDVAVCKCILFWHPFRASSSGAAGAAERRQALLSSSPRHHQRLSIVDCRCVCLQNTGKWKRKRVHPNNDVVKIFGNGVKNT